MVAVAARGTETQRARSPRARHTHPAGEVVLSPLTPLSPSVRLQSLLRAQCVLIGVRIAGRSGISDGLDTWDGGCSSLIPRVSNLGAKELPSLP